MKQTFNLPTFNFRIYILVLALILSTLACGLGQPKPTPTQAPTAVEVIPTKAPEKTQEPTPTNPPAISGELIREWASAGEATSEYGSSDWSGQQAAGAPNTLTCGDHITAWAVPESDSVESIMLYYYDPPLIPTEINIVQSYNPSQVVKVELLDAYGEYSDAMIYESEPKATDECPYTLSIPVTGIDYLVMGVRITIDQSVLGLGWNEIDAVQLIGYPEPGTIVPSVPPPAGSTYFANFPLYENAESVSYTEYSLNYTVRGGDRLAIRDFYIAQLPPLGWHLDRDENGNCIDENSCMSQNLGLDYSDPSNTRWFFIDGADDLLQMTLTEENGIVYVLLNLT